MDELRRHEDDELPAEVVGRRDGFTALPPTPEELESMRLFFINRRDQLTRDVAEIEALLGFVRQSDDLAVRVARIELFVGINKS